MPNYSYRDAQLLELFPDQSLSAKKSKNCTWIPLNPCLFWLNKVGNPIHYYYCYLCAELQGDPPCICPVIHHIPIWSHVCLMVTWLQEGNHKIYSQPYFWFQTQNIHQNPTPEDIYDFGLFLIEKIRRRSNKSLRDWPMLPLPQQNWEHAMGNWLIAEQCNYNQEEQMQYAEDCIPNLNPEQWSAFNKIVEAVENKTGQTYFLHGPGGTGKTYVYNTLCYFLRGWGLIVLCVASSGIAALLLIGGHTAHSIFKIPINIHESSLCGIKKKTLYWQLLLEQLIWLYGMRLQCKVAIYMKLLTVHSKMFKTLIAHLEVYVLSLEEILNRFFLLSSKEIRHKLLEFICSAVLFGSLSRFSSLHKIWGSMQPMNMNTNLHNGSWILDIGDMQMKMEISIYQITYTVERTQSSHSFKPFILASHIMFLQQTSILLNAPFWPAVTMMLILSTKIFSDNFQERSKHFSVLIVSRTTMEKVARRFSCILSNI